MVLKNNVFVIGVDGGGTKTVAAIADLKGNILKIGKAGSASPRNIRIKAAARNVAEAINKIMPKKKARIASTFVGLPAIQERPELASKIKKELLLDRRISLIFQGEFKIGSDQIAAFRSGTNKKEGVVLIAGTGAVAHGWKQNKQYKASGWGWLADEGCAFWIGQKVYQAIFKDLDGRGSKTLLTKFTLSGLKVRTEKDLRNFVYSGSQINAVAALSLFCDKIAHKGDREARNILLQAGQELAFSAAPVIKKLNFSKEKFPLVLVGGVLKSKIVLSSAKKEIKKIGPKVEFIQPKQEPVLGAIRLAMEQLKANN